MGQVIIFGIANRLELYCPGIESDISHLSRPALGASQPPEPGLFPGGRLRDMSLITHLLLAPRLKKVHRCISTPRLGLHGLF